MAYSTGAVNDPATLLTNIENFATANGWTLNAGTGSWLSKGDSHVKLDLQLAGLVSSITRVGTLATVTMTIPHHLTGGETITISGASDALYNITAVINYISTTSFSYTMAGTPAANAAGTLVATGSTTMLNIMGSCSSDGLTNPSDIINSVFVIRSSWPITYYLYSNVSPDMIVCVLVYDTVKVQTLIFGDIVKIASAAYTGGNFFHASRSHWCDPVDDDYTTIGLYECTDTTLKTYVQINPSNSTTYSRNASPILLAPDANAENNSQAKQGFHVEIDGQIWDGVVTGAVASARTVHLADYTKSLLFRSPNSWNSQANLVPIHLQFKSAASNPYYMALGYIEHLRYIRVDNYNIGDLITIGSDTWAVFPWYIKNSANRNGSVANPTTLGLGSGTIGFAVRKT